MREFIVTRPVAIDDIHNYGHRAFVEGETLYEFLGHTYGCIDNDYDHTTGEPRAIAVSESPSTYPFFEFPYDALREVERT